jgi:hypothetical protein
MESPPRLLCSVEAPRFLVDAMLGRLAKWLRILGYDAEYFPGEDDDLLRQARRQGRVLLTRDTRLLRRRPLPSHLFIESDQVMEQLRQVVTALRLDPAAPPARAARAAMWCWSRATGPRCSAGCPSSSGATTRSSGPAALPADLLGGDASPADGGGNQGAMPIKLFGSSAVRAVRQYGNSRTAEPPNAFRE